MEWSSSFYGFSLELTKSQAAQASHQGSCDADVLAVSKLPKVARQLRAIDPAKLRAELQGYGAWDDAELADHEQNLQRLVWLAAGDINDQVRS